MIDEIKADTYFSNMRTIHGELILYGMLPCVQFAISLLCFRTGWPMTI